MYSYAEFTDMIDGMIPKEIQEAIDLDIQNNDQEFGFMDLANLQEKARVYTIKKNISNTHKWCKATSVDSDGNKVECFWCEKCNIRCSMFEHISCLSIISKVKDNLPTYTTHNEYLMLTCDEIKELQKNETDVYCYQCGVAESGQTNKCSILGGS